MPIGPANDVPVHAHRLLYGYFADEGRLGIRTVEVGPWRWLDLDTDVDVGQAVVSGPIGSGG